MMIISERIFLLLEERGMTQKEFSEKTGIAQGAISDWKRKRTNPNADKILMICDVLGVTPNELLSGAAHEDGRSRKTNYIVIDKNSEMGTLVEFYEALPQDTKKRILRYAQGLKDVL